MRLGVERFTEQNPSTRAPDRMTRSGGSQNMSYENRRQSTSKRRMMASRSGSSQSMSARPDVSGWKWLMSFCQTSVVARKSTGTRSGSMWPMAARTRSSELYWGAIGGILWDVARVRKKLYYILEGAC